MARIVRVLSVLLPLLAGCSHLATTQTSRVTAAAPAPVAGPEWLGIATPADRVLIAALPQSWARATSRAGRRTLAARQAEGAILDPAVALESPALPPGSYYCRLLRFGARATFRTFKPDFCYVEIRDGKLGFTKQTGSTLPTGWILPDTATRQIFLGTLKGASTPGEAPVYGHSAADVAGIVERVSPFRWRLTLTRAGAGSLLDLYELVPITPAVPGATPTLPPPE